MNGITCICPYQQSGDAARKGRPAYVFALVCCCLVFLAPIVRAAAAAATNVASGAAALSLEEGVRRAQELLTRGKEAEAQARGMEDPELSSKARESARVLYLKAAEAFEHAARDFPAHKRAHKAALLAGQCRMRAKDWDQASRILTALSENKAIDAEIQAENLYWLGNCNVYRGDHTNAYRSFKRLMWDYPESSWARHIPRRLDEPHFRNIQGD
jgi:tetratricopeptide (TPR) repeat protein